MLTLSDIGDYFADTISGFTAGSDKIHLDHRTFTAWPSDEPDNPDVSYPVALTAASFNSGTTLAMEGDDRIFYDTDDKKLHYDGDGSGTSSQTYQIAALGSLSGLLSAADFLII